MFKLISFENHILKIEDNKITIKGFNNFHDIQWTLKNYFSTLKALQEIDLSQFQPERSKRKDSQQCEMRCSEHCGNTMREAQ